MAKIDLAVGNDQAADPYLINLGYPLAYPFSSKAGAVSELVNGVVDAGVIVPSNYIGMPKALWITAVSSGSPTTLVFESSYDGVDWFQSTHAVKGVAAIFNLLDGTNTTQPLPGATISFPLNPSPYYRVKNSTSTYLIIRHYATF